MINRDGYTISLWQQHISAFPLGSTLQAHVYDVIIVGGGITGVTTAFLLQEAGFKCLLLEAANLGYGTTGGTTAHLNTLLDVSYETIGKNFGEQVARAVAVASANVIGFIEKMAQEYAIDCGFKTADAYQYAQNKEQDDALASQATAATNAGLDVGRVATLPLPLRCTSAIQVKGQAMFSPLPYLYELAKEFENIGGVILENTRVTNIEHKGKVEVTAGEHTFAGRKLVLATHIPPGINLLHLRCISYRSYAVAARLAQNDYPQDLYYDMEEPFHYIRSQEVDGEQYLIVGGEDHKTGHHENTNLCFRQLEAWVNKHFNVLEVTHRWSSQFYEPVDGLPYIGQLPGEEEDVYVATGFSGNGMIYGTIAALLLRDMLLGVLNELEMIFDPNRLKPIAGFSNFISHNADVAMQYVNKLLPAASLHLLADLAPGEGRVIKYESGKMAVYKDEGGELHSVSPVCTHLKCDVSWNSGEKSWDCPCHGARYNPDGQVLNCPATMALEPLHVAATVK
ncbi:FAD-dependent oxidoreductase [Chitinophaga sp. sic0106]|uniref:FAD-dependent oxidoreductase n=1 Tax=Chitinophaga sp. sic0106 TaxID=2854785 RepID=UPI001C47977E|nr:FAD-dependent oxidoreductase [Chitinophaga sp. sic0106]MBV7533776.1 FAD-dependent oxidoreductase [Chitinophaga sp. sic0106]